MSTLLEPVELSASARRRRILRHLQALYPPGTPGELLAYVKKPFKRLFGRPDDLESFADGIVALDQAGCDVYLTINTLDGAAVRARGPRARGCEAEVAAVVAIVADIDAGLKPRHEYPTQLEVHKALLEMPRYPSMVVVSGRKQGGLHVYWLLDRPYEIHDPADRHRLKNISRRMQEVLRSKLNGRDMDSTYDLVRVLRPVGCTNYKYGTVVLEAHELDPAMRAQAEAGLGASLDEAPYDRDSIDEIEAALPSDPPLPDAHLPSVKPLDDRQAQTMALAEKWLSRRPPAIAASHGGGGGDAHTYNTAVCLVHGFGLPIDAALPLLWRWNQRCLPPWTQDELRRKLQCADAWKASQPRGWLCSLVMSQTNGRTDLNTPNCDIPTQFVACPTPKGFKIQTRDTGETVRIAIPCGKRRVCDACRSNWVVRNYRAIDRALADAISPFAQPEGAQHKAPCLYTGEVDAAGLRAACKYLERGKRQHGLSPRYVAILRPGGARLLITLAPYTPHCRPLADPSELRKEIYEALQEVPLNGNRGVTHSQGWLAKKKPSRRSAPASDAIKIVHSRFQDLEVESESAKLVLTDPPWGDAFLAEWEELGAFARRVLVDGGLFVSYCGHVCLDKVMASLSKHLTYRWINAISHRKTYPVQVGEGEEPFGRVLTRWKPILIFSKGDFPERGQWVDLIEGTGKEKDWHPWQQSLGEVEQLVQCFSDPGDLVCDPCGGGFTTALACAETGRRCISCDCDAVNVEKGRRRLSARPG